MKRSLLVDVLVFALLVVVGIGSRLLQDWSALFPPNFHAVAATTLFAGYFFARRSIALHVPIVAMVLSDLIIGGYDLPVMITVYSALALPVVWRTWLRKDLGPVSVGTAAISSSIIFFVATNFAVWAAWANEYTLASLVRCYTVALPFFAYTLCGDLMYAGLVFSVYGLVCYGLRRTEPRWETA